MFCVRASAITTKGLFTIDSYKYKNQGATRYIPMNRSMTRDSGHRRFVSTTAEFMRRALLTLRGGAGRPTSWTVRLIRQLAAAVLAGARCRSRPMILTLRTSRPLALVRRNDDRAGRRSVNPWKARRPFAIGRSSRFRSACQATALKAPPNPQCPAHPSSRRGHRGRTRHHRDRAAGY